MLSEDRADYERTLDQALRSVPERPELAALGQRLNAEQLRIMALRAAPLITAAAASEYEHYVTVRERRGAPAPSSPSSPHPDEAPGAGPAAVLAVLAPVLAGTAAVIFLLVGYVLHVLNPESAFSRTLITLGWLFCAVTAVSLLVASAGLLLTALRNSTGPPRDEPGEEVTRAREAWREALTERGIVPFLRDALADPGSPAAPHRTMPSPPTTRTSGLTRPDLTSPDFGGPEHGPE
ncbi:RTA1 domain-containing protein [Streptomyces sp. SID5643]|uniref:RTA1 domain-containing protein n=1 Tax=Streptomyces sp. SID5643 TaxID=2690307 RepID=UPI00136CA9A0|nr:RTA1 domain-containing protein [Streptomyces sp. SID5643]MZF87900.1 hypothetical protein [Streptomyces sp. SID5643]